MIGERQRVEMNHVRTDRTWPLPRQPWIMRMTWSELLFAHWAFEPDAIAALLPKGVPLDTRDGKAWVGVVPFLMSNVAPRCCPAIPRLSCFPELNVRTYVTIDGKPGVWFFSLDAANRIAVRLARAAFYLPYMDATMSLRQNEGGSITYRSQRTHRGEPAAEFDADYSVCGDFAEAAPGSLEHWLTARYCLYSANRQGCVFRGEIDHPPWLLANANYTERTNTMIRPLQLDLTDKPHVLIAKAIDVRAWILTRCRLA